MDIPLTQLKKWIAALDSGKYPQGRFRLQNVNGYCCLGVACDVLIPKNKIKYNKTAFIRGSLPDAQPFAPEWLKDISMDFHYKTGKTISSLNDSYNYTFPEIATLLELVFIHKILN